MLARKPCRFGDGLASCLGRATVQGSANEAARKPKLGMPLSGLNGLLDVDHSGGLYLQTALLERHGPWRQQSDPRSAVLADRADFPP